MNLYQIIQGYNIFALHYTSFYTVKYLFNKKYLLSNIFFEIHSPTFQRKEFSCKTLYEYFFKLYFLTKEVTSAASYVFSKLNKVYIRWKFDKNLLDRF